MQVECIRCGLEWEIKNPRRQDHYCASCRARKVQTVAGDIGPCIPWHGRFAGDFATPIDDDGVVVVPGVRICGKADCVAPKHVRERFS